MPNEVTSDARPSRITVGTHSIDPHLLVNGAATDASVSDSDMPVWAARSAPQSRHQDDIQKYKQRDVAENILGDRCCSIRRNTVASIATHGNCVPHLLQQLHQLLLLLGQHPRKHCRAPTQ